MTPRQRQALMGAVEALRMARRDIKNWFTSNVATQAAIAPIDKAITEAEAALMGEN